MTGDTCMEKKVALLELKSLNEQQRADHAVSVIEEYKSTIKKLEQRNAELQEKFTKLTEIGSEQQRVEEELRLSLEG